MANGRAVDREDPDNSRREVARSLDWDPICELHQGPRSYAPHREAGHMTAPDHVAKNVFNPFAGGGRPHISSAPPRALYLPRWVPYHFGKWTVDEVIGTSRLPGFGLYRARVGGRTCVHTHG